jgi:hypothetical protein
MKSFILAVLVSSLFVGPALADLTRFDQDVYAVQPGETFAVKLLLDVDETLPGYQLPDSGLFSMGIKLLFDSSNAVVTSVDSIVIPDPLNSDGLGGDAPREVGQGFAGAAGARPLGSTEGYSDPLLVTILVTDLNALDPAESYDLNLDFFYPEPFENFLDYEQNPLDSGIDFGMASVLLVPEPASGLLMMFGGATLLLKAAKRRRTGVS